MILYSGLKARYRTFAGRPTVKQVPPMPRSAILRGLCYAVGS